MNAPTQPPAWTGEREVGVEAAAALIARRFPQLSERPVAALAEGWDSAVFTVGDEWAFQFPRRAAVLPGLRREIEVLPRIASALPLPISVPELVADDDRDDDPWPFAGCALIPGVELADAGLGQRDRVSAAAAMGRFLRALHSIDVSPYTALLPVDPNGRGTPARGFEHTQKSLDGLTGRRVLELEPGARAGIDGLLRVAAELPEPAGPFVLVHGDLHARHVIVDDEGSATGVIDWVDVCLADSALDLSLGYAAFAGPARDAFLEGYGIAFDGERELRARALGLRLCVMLADYASSVGRRSLVAESVAGMARTLT